MIWIWIVANAHWFIPLIGWIYSEYLGWKSGGEKASVSQIISDFIKYLVAQVKQ